MEFSQLFYLRTLSSFQWEFSWKRVPQCTRTSQICLHSHSCCYPHSSLCSCSYWKGFHYWQFFYFFSHRWEHLFLLRLHSSYFHSASESCSGCSHLSKSHGVLPDVSYSWGNTRMKASWTPQRSYIKCSLPSSQSSIWDCESWVLLDSVYCFRPAS